MGVPNLQRDHQGFPVSNAGDPMELEKQRRTDRTNSNMSVGELDEGRPPSAPGVDTESDRLHAEKDQIPRQSIGPHTRDPQSENPEGAVEAREKMQSYNKGKETADAQE